jgi:FtsH-binding integral membrane protein
MAEAFGYFVWLIIGISAIYFGALIRYLLFNKHKRNYKSISNDYFYSNWILGIFIFLLLFFLTKYLLGYDLVKES